MYKSRKAMTAVAHIRGIKGHEELYGRVIFKQMNNGVLVTAQIYGLPTSPEKNGVFGFHIHEGTTCTGNSMDALADALKHYNPQEKDHPYHAGDMPPLFGNNGYAYMSFYTSRFDLKEIMGRVVIIHDSPDDFMTQPSGNSGKKIACGKIVII
jgi:Cu-Zn family superoxide dismutase